jgi:WD40 repeat protein
MTKTILWRIGLALLVIGVVMRITSDRMRADEVRWSRPVNLGGVVNSPADEAQVTITHSSLSLYFSSDRPGGFGNTDIWVSHRSSVQAPWGEPRNLGLLVNAEGAEFAPSFSPDDHWMFFPSGRRPDGLGSLDIYVTYRADVTDDFGWQPAVNLGSSVNSAANDADPFYFVDPETGEATLYFVSNRLGTFDIYESARNPDGSFRQAVLNKALSTAAYGDRHLTIRSDGLELIFTSDRPGGMGGLDLWVSTRNTTHDLWTKPVNLGPPVNSEFDDRGPALSSDGVTLFFSSTRPGGLGLGDFWRVTRGPQ